MERLDLGLISRRETAKELAIGYATLKRLLDARWQPVHPEHGVPTPDANHGRRPQRGQGLTESLNTNT